MSGCVHDRKEEKEVEEKKTVGKYRIIRKLGKGGEGSVWLALHMQTQKLRALKEISLPAGNDLPTDRQENTQENPRGDLQENLHELKMLRRMRHGSLPDILDVIETPQQVYLVMEYIRGRNLEDVIRECGRLPKDQVLSVALHMCRALDYLHTRPQKILHLDVKPANIILTEEGRIVLVDFGAALFQKETAVSRRKGTDGFASPEQYRQEVELDERSDLYSLGAVLYFLISGVRYAPFMYKSRIPGCPEGLDHILRKCLHPDRAARYLTCRELMKDLTQYQKKNSRQKKRTLFWAALLIVVFSGTSAYYGIQGQLEHKVIRSFDYQQLLEEASCCERRKAMEYYRQAVFLEPARKEAYLQLLGELDRDGRFDRTEEDQLRSLLHSIPYGSDRTYEELLQENPSAYGEVACRIGLMYRFDYTADQTAGGRIAAGWFQRARQKAEALDTQENWGRIAAVFDDLYAADDSGVLRQLSGRHAAAACFEGLRQLVGPDMIGQLSSPMRTKLCLEALGRIASCMHQMYAGGISLHDLNEMIETLEQTGEGEEEEDNDKIHALAGQCRQLSANLAGLQGETEG